MLRRALRAFAPLFTVCMLSIVASAAASPAKVGPSTSIDALGDSITRGYDSQGTGCGSFADCPANSWATGTNAGLNSYYVRTKAVNPSVVLAQPVKTSTTGGNDAVTGAKMNGLPGQAANAVKAPNTPDQVLILLGANDVCTSTEAGMTSVASFRSNYKSGLETLSSGLPDARIDVSSIPNIFNLWSVLHTSTAAQLTWGLAKICQSMLAEPTSESAAAKTRRANVQKRNEEFNAVLAEVCAEFIHCQYDKGAAYAIKFATSDVSTLDYFHPTTNGQNKAAETAWNNGPKFSDLTTPTTTISRDREADGSEGWYRNDVTVKLSASDSEYAVAGTEYKLGAASTWTRYTGPITISSEGQTTITARSVDVNGNIEASQSTTIKIDKTPPTFTLSCPSEAITLGSSASASVSEASDALSGFEADPNGQRPLNTAAPGNGREELLQIHDRAGNTTTHSCSYDVHYPDPGAPVLSNGASPNNDGLFTLAWDGSDPSLFGITYTLQHRDASGAEWSLLAGPLSSLEFALSGAGEQEGTWTYRVQGSDPALGLTTSWSPSSAAVVVDKSAPAAPSASADRAPDYAGGGGWYKDTVTVSFTDNGDPLLADGSAGSGVNLASLTAPQSFSTDGSHVASATVADNVGNVSAAGSLSVQVDSSPPSVEVSCPAFTPVGSIANASVSASDGQSGLASDPSGTVAIDTSKAGEQSASATAIDNVGHEASSSCATVVGYPDPGAPSLSAGTNPSASGLFTLAWTGADPAQYSGLSYTLEHRNAASPAWSVLAGGITALSYELLGTGEEEGTWNYRVQGSDPSAKATTAWSAPSALVKVDKSAPAAPSASADRAPDYAGGGGWYKDTVTVSFTDNGDPLLADGSSGSGVDLASLTAPQSFSTDGSHEASGTVADNAGNLSAPGNLSVQVDATAPSVQVSCPESVLIGTTGVKASVTASDGQSGLASDPSGTVAIDTSTAGSRTVARTAIDNVGHSSSASCTTQVLHSIVITGSLTRKLVVKAGQAVELAPSAKVHQVKVEAGGVLDVEGASVAAIGSRGASLIRICGASVSGGVSVLGSTGSVTIGDGTPGCAANSFAKALLLRGNLAGTTVAGNLFHESLKVNGNSGGVSVSGNVVETNLIVIKNTGPVVDHPNTVTGISKLQ
jgi:lysophospholipase L1-like esterase